MQHNELTISISSFSYKKNSPLADPVHGCGFVFDMRAIDNPGRLEAYRSLSGLDTAVADYLCEKTAMQTFLTHCRALIDLTIMQYMQRGFESLNINFGCTGGQHRSVYAAEDTAAYIREKFGLTVHVRHLNRANWL